MARTSRYGAIRKYRAEQDAKTEKIQSQYPPPSPQVIEGTQKWIQSVVSGASSLRLCPFAANKQHSIEVCNFPSAKSQDPKTLYKDYVWFVYKAARELSRKQDSKTFQSTLVVFPHYDEEITDLYEKILKDYGTYIGGVEDKVPQKTKMWEQHIQAFPFEGYSVNEAKRSKGLPTRPVTALAPWTTIQLIRYADFAKIPKKLRQHIMDRNDATMDQLEEVEKLALLRDCVVKVNIPELASLVEAETEWKKPRRSKRLKTNVNEEHSR